MSYANGTTHYNLPQTVGTDKRDWTDTNEAFSAVDTALYGAVQDAETATSGIQTLNTAVETINGKLTTDENNISTLSGKVSTLESTVSGHTSAIADVRQDLQDNIESHREASATSTHAYAVGDYFYYNDVLYKATSEISIGGTIVPSTNCTAVTVMSELKTETTISADDVSFDPTGTDLASTDVEDALKEINSKVSSDSFTVTADGVKTTSQLLDEVFSGIDQSKLVPGKSYISFHSEGWVAGRVQSSVFFTNNGESLNFFNAAATGATEIGLNMYILKASGSNNLVGALSASSVTDYGSSVAAAGSTYNVTY